MSGQLQIQRAIYEMFAQSPGVGYSVYDDVPQDTDYPYIVIGDDTSEPFDSKTFDGFEVSVVIHSWSRYSGKKQVKEMMGAVYNLLHNQQITVPDYHFVLCLLEFEETFLEDDGVTRHGIQRFNFIITDES